MKVETFTSAILSKITGIGKVQLKFFVTLTRLFLSLRGRYTFLNLARFGEMCEQSYRLHFSNYFDFKTFNAGLISEHCSDDLVLVFDPSYLAKSGKHTPGIGYFWSGCAGAVKWGLEICGLAIADLVNHTAMHYHAVQTNVIKGEESLLGFYAKLLVEQADVLKKKSKILVVDAFFSKKSFIDALLGVQITVVSRLRSGTFMRYKFIGEQKNGRGRKRVFGSRIDPKDVSPAHFTVMKSDENEIIWEGEAHVRALKRWCKVVIRQVLKDGKIHKTFLYFSTDLEMAGERVIRIYTIRFQIEFLYRDAKQFLGLTDSQSRQPEAISFHVNMSLTTLNIAKALHWLSIPKEERPPFSMADIKTQYSNQLLLDRIIRVYGKDPEIEKNNPKIRKIYETGRIAA